MSRQFRLIDLIVVVACVALMLMGLANAHLQSRKAGTYVTCRGNMRQVALALIQYLNANDRFPPSQFTQTGTSGLMMTLPYLESQDLYNAYNFELPRWVPENAGVVSQRVSIFECLQNPDRSPVPAADVRRLSGRHDPGVSSYAKGHYAVNWGGGRGGWGRNFEKIEGQNRGLMRSVTDINMGGPLPLISSNDLIDGLSTTLLLTEKRDSQGWAVGGWAGSEFDVGTSPAMKTGDPWGDKVYSGSYHVGGVNAAFCDGSARFLGEKMDRKAWYALITRDGGEPVVDDGDGFILKDKP